MREISDRHPAKVKCLIFLENVENTQPALIIVAILAALAEWNDFLGPLIYLKKEEDFTLAIGLAQFTGLYHSQWNLLMAASTLVVVPVIILFFLHRNISLKELL